MKDYADVDAFLVDATRWRDVCARLRTILLDCGLDEAIKWGKPCYSHPRGNIVILQPMSRFLALMFFKGVLLDDPEGLLQEQGENTHSARRLCFESAAQVDAMEAAVRDFVRKAIVVEEGELPLPERPDLVLAAEIRERLDQDPAFKAAFEALTPGRQREYHLFVSGAKQSKTRAARVEKHVARILAGKGLRDR
jgi:uncharacterized protein YdeI (YjbR/CyaY-like superfamily)